jgi:hypothetical protein
MNDRLFPLSYPQRMFWFLDKLEPDTPAYNLPRAFRLEGQLDIDALREAFHVLLRRHDVLRTCFAELDGELYQCIRDDVAIDFVQHDLSRLSASKHEIETLAIASEEARKPFDLERPPLFRLRLLRLSPENHVLILVMHHIVTDGWSMSILFFQRGRSILRAACGRPATPHNGIAAAIRRFRALAAANPHRGSAAGGRGILAGAPLRVSGVTAIAERSPAAGRSEPPRVY